MLTREERVKSFAHRKLKQLEYYEDASEYQGKVPIEVDMEQLVGVYSNSTSDRIFILLYGFYLQKSDRFIPYKKMISLETNYEDVGKQNTHTIFISLRDNNVIPLEILGRKIVTVNKMTREFGELWEFYSFLMNVYNK